VDIVTILDSYTPDFLLLAETPLLSGNGVLTHILRNRGYKRHFHPTNAPSPPDTLPEARIRANIINSGWGCWIAYKKHSTWSTKFRPLFLPTYFPMAFTCAVELTLLTGKKAANIASYLPSPVKEHARVCQALVDLSSTLPHHLLVLGCDL